MNTVSLVGRLGAEPELKEVGDSFVVNFSLATDRREKGEKVTDWHRCSLWGKSAQAFATHLHKGEVVGVNGAVTYRRYEKEGVEHIATEIKCSGFSFIPGANKKNEEGEF